MGKKKVDEMKNKVVVLTLKKKVQMIKNELEPLVADVASLKEAVNGSRFGHFQDIMRAHIFGAPVKKTRIDECFEEIKKINKKLDALAGALDQQFVFCDGKPGSDVMAVTQVGPKAGCSQ